MKILVVDDNRSSADALARALNKRGYEATSLYDGAEAISRIEHDAPDLVLTDLKMEPVDGMQVLRAARSQRPPVEAIVFTAYGAIDTAVEAIQLGAHDFLTKPVTLDQVLSRIDGLQRPVAAQTSHAFVAQGPTSLEFLDTLQRVASFPSHVWLEGEVGSGRGHAATTIHELSPSEDPIITVDVARMVNWPTKGSVLIPNVDDLPDDLQRELVIRLRSLPAGVRVLATAGPNARERIGAGRLHPELYYELAVIVLPVPSLRDRPEDIVPLAQAALERFATRYGRDVPPISDEQAERLTQHSWPGNIRELLNMAERAVVLGPAALDAQVVRKPSSGLPNLVEGFSLSDWLEDAERKILVEALRRARGDRTLAGRLLGVERNTLRYKLNKYGLLDR